MKFEQFNAKITKKSEEVSNQSEVKKEFDDKMNNTMKEFVQGGVPHNYKTHGFSLTDSAEKFAKNVEFGDIHKYNETEYQHVEPGTLKDNLRMIEGIKQKSHSVESLWDKVVEKNKEFKNKLLASKVATFTGVVGGLTATFAPLVDKLTDGGIMTHVPQLYNMIPDFAQSSMQTINSPEAAIALIGSMATLLGGLYGGSLISKFKKFTDNERLLKAGAMVINKHNELHGAPENTKGVNPDIEEKIES